MPDRIGKDIICRKTTLKTHGRRKKISQKELQKKVRAIAEFLKQNPRKIDDETKEELEKLITIIERSNPDFSEKARELLSSIGTAADIAQLITFLSGVPSLPALLQVLRIANGILDCYSKKSRKSSYRERKLKIPKSVTYI